MIQFHMMRVINYNWFQHVLKRVWDSAVYIGARRTINDDEYNGYKIPPKTNIWYLTWFIHHDKRYFQDPYLFKPERFLKSRRGTNYHSFCYIPFGHGARQCIGFRLAQLEMRIVIAHFIKNFR